MRLALLQNTVRIHVLPTEDIIALAKSRLTRTLTPEECQQYLHVEMCPTGPWRLMKWLQVHWKRNNYSFLLRTQVATPMIPKNDPLIKYSKCSRESPSAACLALHFSIREWDLQFSWAIPRNTAVGAVDKIGGVARHSLVVCSASILILYVRLNFVVVGSSPHDHSHRPSLREFRVHQILGE
jgi:hypothetical protein